MNILLVAPHPWYQERGTPIAVNLLVQVLTNAGHKVDLLTFNEGEDKHYSGLQITRVQPPWSITGIMPGFSLKKVFMDFFLFWKMWGMVRKKKYDVIHAVEESAFFGVLFSRGKSTKFVYDMDSSIAAQMIDRFPLMKGLNPLLKALESIPIRMADAVVPVCVALENLALEYRDDAIFTIKDVSLITDSEISNSVSDIRAEHDIDGPIFMYIGNLESYQGIDLMLESFAVSLKSNANCNLVVIGGSVEKINHYEKMAAGLGLSSQCHFLGQKPVADIDDYMQQADVMVSPRVHGENTPMKLYSYLDSGRAVLATNLPTHTQVADSDVAYLAAPTAEEFGLGFATLASDSELRERLASRAKIFIELNHSFPVFESKVLELYSFLAED